MPAALKVFYTRSPSERTCACLVLVAPGFSGHESLADRTMKGSVLSSSMESCNTLRLCDTLDTHSGCRHLIMSTPMRKYKMGGSLIRSWKSRCFSTSLFSRQHQEKLVTMYPNFLSALMNQYIHCTTCRTPKMLSTISSDNQLNRRGAALVLLQLPSIHNVLWIRQSQHTRSKPSERAFI